MTPEKRESLRTLAEATAGPCGMDGDVPVGITPNEVLALLSALDTAIERAEKAEGLIDRLRREAEQHAQEARTANATIAEIYQAVTDATGEPGNWNGAEPVRAKLTALRARVADLEGALRPFAERATRWEENHPVRSVHQHRDSTQITHRLGDFRTARKTLGAAND